MNSPAPSSTIDGLTSTLAALRADTGLKVPEGLMGKFASNARGKPTNEQRSLYLAGVTFAYAVWESYIEDVAIEMGGYLSRQITPDNVPEPVGVALAERSAWELSVTPGWRQLWADEIRIRAVGAEGSGYGINTASYSAVRSLFAVAGISEALPTRLAVTPDSHLGAFRETPKKTSVNTSKAGESSVDVKTCLQRLIEVRGEAVHTAKTTSPLFKREVLWFTAFVRQLIETTDVQAIAAVRSQLAA